MIAVPSAAVRLGLLALLAVLLQISVVAQVPILGGRADLVPLFVAAVGLFAGPVPGAVSGFAAGLLLDLALGLNVGVSSLVLTAVGYGVGIYRDARDPANGLVPIPLGAAATAGYLVAFGVLNFMLDVGAVSGLVIREIIVTVIVNALLALPVFAVVRRVLRPVLTADPLGRRRTSRTREPGTIGLRGLEV